MLTDEQKVARAVTRENNRRIKEAPLLAASGLLAPTTQEEQRNRLKAAAAMAAENCGGINGRRILQTLTEMHLARLVGEIVGSETLARLCTHCRRVYPSVEYWIGFWARVLTGDRVVFGWRMEPTGQRRLQLENGQDLLLPTGKLIEDGVIQLAPPPLTREQAQLLAWPKLTPEPADDGGLWLRVQAAIDRASNR